MKPFGAQPYRLTGIALPMPQEIDGILRNSDCLILPTGQNPKRRMMCGHWKLRPSVMATIAEINRLRPLGNRNPLDVAIPNGYSFKYNKIMNTRSSYPTTRLRRLRYHPAVRTLVRETQLHPSRLVLPLFARPGKNVRQPIGSMPPHAQLSVDQIAEEAKLASKMGLGGIILFGIPAEKDACGSDSYCDGGIIQQAIRAAKDAAPDLLVMTDLCFCEYTDHGHCGPIDDHTGRMDVNNDATLPLLSQTGR